MENLHFCTTLDSITNAILETIARAFQSESHLLPVTVGDLRQSLVDGLALVVLAKGEPVGCTRLVPLTDGWWELGSTWVREDCRRQGLNHDMYKAILPLHPDKNILATTTNPGSVRVGTGFGFVLVLRKHLPEAVWRATCVCPADKTGVADNAFCRLAFGESNTSRAPCCWVRITKETADRLGFSQGDRTHVSTTFSLRVL